MGRSKHPFKSSILSQALVFYLSQSPPLQNIWPSKLSMRRTTLSASCGNGLPRPSSWRTMWNLHPAAAEAAPHVSRRELMWSGSSGGGGSSSSSTSSSGTSSPPTTTERHPSFVLVVDMASKTTTTPTAAAASKIEGAHLWKKATEAQQQLLSSVVVLGLRHRPRLFAWNRELKRRIVCIPPSWEKKELLST